MPRNSCASPMRFASLRLLEGLMYMVDVAQVTRFMHNKSVQKESSCWMGPLQ